LTVLIFAVTEPVRLVNLLLTVLQTVLTVVMVSVRPVEVRMFLLVKPTVELVETIFVNTNSKIQKLAQKIVVLVEMTFVM